MTTTIESELELQLAESLDFVKQFPETAEVAKFNPASRNDVERMDLWDLAVTTTSVLDLNTLPLYARILVEKARKCYPHFDPAWRKSHGYPEVV